MAGHQERTVSLLTGTRADGWTYKSLAEREVTRSVTESDGQGHEQREQLHISGGGYAKRIAIGETNNFTFLVAMRLGDTPVLIPNT